MTFSDTLHNLARRVSPRQITRWRPLVERVLAEHARLEHASEEDLLKRARELRWRATAGESLGKLLPEAFALVRESAWRSLRKRHFEVQILGGIAIFHGHIAEMQTGEGKTLTATLPTFLRALPGKGCHVVTVNDYLARRDAENNRPVFERLGMSLSCIQSEMEEDERREAYSKDVTYSTANELGFDYLRDRLKSEARNPHLPRRQADWLTRDEGVSPPVHRGFEFALIDEADSVLIDDARTPLIISMPVPNTPETTSLLKWSGFVADRLNEDDFEWDREQKRVHLTQKGGRRVVLWKKPSLIDDVESDRLYDAVEQALTARLVYRNEKDYIIADDEVTIVDESTGRMMDGRKWEQGLHQAVEAKERVTITAGTGAAARITLQSFYRLYHHLAGMTGTARPAARELKKCFGLKVTVIPTNRPCIRKGMPPRIFATLAAKHQAVALEIVRLREQGRAILVGTPSVAASETLALVLERMQIPSTILNARFHATEAEIVAEAGRRGQVTIATNMAGRGTDILLGGSPESIAWRRLRGKYPSRVEVPAEEWEAAVREAHDHPDLKAERKLVSDAGGLHVIATEMHTSARIDRQLIGRAARQGDPGSYQFLLSLEDELLRSLPHEELIAHQSAARPDANGELAASWLRLFERTQRRIEKQHAKHRRHQLQSEQVRQAAHRRMGLDPCLEFPE